MILATGTNDIYSNRIHQSCTPTTIYLIPEACPTQDCGPFHQTEHILKVIDGQILLYPYCCKDLSHSRLWCSTSVTLSTSSHLVSASVPGKHMFLLLKKITRLFLPLPSAYCHHTKFASAIAAPRLILTICLFSKYLISNKKSSSLPLPMCLIPSLNYWLSYQAPYPSLLPTLHPSMLVSLPSS